MPVSKHPHGMRHDVVAAVRKFSVDPKDCVENATHPAFIHLRRSPTYARFKATLQSLLTPGTHCEFCATQMTERHRTPTWNFGRCLAFVEHDSTLIVPTLHRVCESELTSLERKQIRQAHDRAASESGLTSSRLLSCLDDQETLTCTIGHLHYRVVSTETYVSRTNSFRPPGQTRREFERLLTFMHEMQEEGGFDVLFPEAAAR